MCYTPLITYPCCGKQWTPKPDQNFEYTIFKFCENAGRDAATWPGALVPCINGPSTDRPPGWNSLDHDLHYPGCCSTCQADNTTVERLKKYMRSRARYFGERRADAKFWAQEAMWDWAFLSIFSKKDSEERKKECREKALKHFQDYFKEMGKQAQVTSNRR
jgi:hypothetical protein